MELRWILLQSCQCALPYHFTANIYAGYFTCAPRDYVVFRARFSSPFESSVDPAVLKANLTSFLTGNERNGIMNINGVNYVISPGPCGVIIPHLNSPHCFNDSRDLEEMPTQPVITPSHQDKTSSATITTTATHNSMTSAPTTMTATPATMAATPATIAATPTTTAAAPTTLGSAQAMVIVPDNTAVIAIVAAMCGTTLTLVFVGCIFVLVLFMKMKKMAPNETPLSQLHWHNNEPIEDGPWVLSRSRQPDSISQKALTEANMSAAADEL